MKKLLLFFVLLAACLQLWAQERRGLTLIRPDSTIKGGFTLPDSLAHLSVWKPDYRTMDPMVIKPSVSMTSVLVVQRENMPTRVMVLDNNTLRLGDRFTLSNGQAWNWGPFLNSFLDARTISVPMPR